jgi:Mycobacterium membrane protein
MRGGLESTIFDAFEDGETVREVEISSDGRRLAIFKWLSRLWIPLLVLAVVIVAGFIVYRVHGYFGSTMNRPRLYAHLPLREGWRDGDQVRREHQGQGGAVGP